MSGDFLHTVLGRTRFPVCRLGLSASYRPGTETVRHAIDEGVNFFFAYGVDQQMIRGLREVMRSRRESIVLATGAYNMIWGYPNLRRTLEKRLRQFATDYIDLFLFMGVMKPKQFPPRALEEMVRFREEGKVRSIGLSTHDRVFAGQLAVRDAVDVLMIRYNAAHRGAERDIFPHLAAHDTGLVSYTATRWTGLLRRPRGWPATRAVPGPGMAYRFVLSSPHVDVCLTAPTSLEQFRANLASVRQGPLSADEMEEMRTFGDAVYRARKWFL